jgi:hypothetical protein
MPFEVFICNWFIWINECEGKKKLFFIFWHFNYGLKWKLIKFIEGLPNLVLGGRP